MVSARGNAAQTRCYLERTDVISKYRHELSCSLYRQPQGASGPQCCGGRATADSISIKLTIFNIHTEISMLRCARMGAHICPFMLVSFGML